MRAFAILIVSLVVLGAITTWSPWLSDDEVLDHVRTSESFVAQQDQAGRAIEDEEITITRTPLGCYVTTIEGGSFVGFWHGL